VNKRELMQRAWLTGLRNDCCISAEDAIKRAGEVWDKHFANDEPATPPPSEWIRFVDRQPTEADCVMGPSGPWVQVWRDNEFVPAYQLLADSWKHMMCKSCYWRPIPKLPEAK
jgi:hypothetical protein